MPVMVEAAPPAPVPDAARDLLVAAMREAGARSVLPRFRALAPADIATKSGPQDLVTLADTEAEAAVTAAVRAGWAGATVLGEEAVAADKGLREAMGTADPCVVIDPVDGTWNFAKGLSVFGMIAAVLRQGRPAWGMLHDPLLDDWIEADATGTRMVTAAGTVRPLATSRETRDGRITGYVAAGLFGREARARLFAAFPDFARVTTLRCACHEYRMVAQGHVEFLLSGPVPHPWDHAAGVLAVQGAGGVARFLDGSPYEAARRRGVILAAGSEALWDRLAARFGALDLGG